MKLRILKWCLLVLLAGLAATCLLRWRTTRQWFDLEQQQLATIMRIGDSPPPGWTSDDWQEALVCPYNIWANSTFHPNSSKLSVDDMRQLKYQLEGIVSATTTENSFESVDRVFELILQFQTNKAFVTNYHSVFRLQCGNMIERMRKGMDYMNSLSEEDMSRWIETTQSLLSSHSDSVPDPYSLTIDHDDLSQELKNINIRKLYISKNEVWYMWEQAFNYTALLVRRMPDNTYQVHAHYSEESSSQLWPKP